VPGQSPQALADLRGACYGSPALTYSAGQALRWPWRFDWPVHDGFPLAGRSGALGQQRLGRGVHENRVLRPIFLNARQPCIRIHTGGRLGRGVRAGPARPECGVMSNYIEFETDTKGFTLLVEADEVEVDPPPGVEKAGILPRQRDGGAAVAVARVSFNEAIANVVRENVRAVTDAVGQLDVSPAEIELTFALKATGEAGNIAIAKVGGEASFQLRLLWRAKEAAT
jgi:Trypsin-co-occurring domain 1